MTGTATYTRPVWFEPFLQQVKKHLGYPVDMAKLKQLLQWSGGSNWSADFKYEKLYAVCRLLFLQKQEHEERFKEIFRDYVISELDYEEQLTRPASSSASISGTGPITEGNDQPDPVSKRIEAVPKAMEEPPDGWEQEEEVQVKKYINLTIPAATEEADKKLINSAGGSRFLLSDAYLPLTTREMIHGWRHLRKKMGWGVGRTLDVVATVKQIAEEGLLINPQFEREPTNSDDLLLILADRRGSMTPFHALTDKLIETAVKDGGHRNAKVYYFYNCPTGYVYRDASLNDPLTLTEMYSMMRPEKTNALIISDAGCARGNMNDLRKEKIIEFLYGDGDEVAGLHKSAMFVSWLNPMPRQRWTNTTASVIDRLPDTPMYSIMEDGYGNFLNIIEKLMGR